MGKRDPKSRKGKVRTLCCSPSFAHGRAIRRVVSEWWKLRVGINAHMQRQVGGRRRQHGSRRNSFDDATQYLSSHLQQIFKGSFGKARPQKNSVLPHVQPAAGPIPIPQKPAGGYFGLPPAAAVLA